MDGVAKQGLSFEDLTIGMSAQLEHTITDGAIRAFADISGDHNPVHLDDAYAAQSRFKTRVAHGMLTASYISAVFGRELPGPGCIYLSQTLNFRAPVRIGDVVTTRVVIQELLPEKRRVVFGCECTVDGKPVLGGEAVLIVPARAHNESRA
jgi:3-hydroxybutyryl-CoA dehydratase